MQQGVMFMRTKESENDVAGSGSGSGSGSGETVARADNYAAVLRVIHEVVERRTHGELLPDRDVVATYPHLAPDLQESLDALRMVQQATSAARKLAPAFPQPPLPLVPLDQLDAPIRPTTAAQDDSDAAADDEEEDAQRPEVPGYTIYREIITGGQATVFKGSQDATGRPVAIKVLPGGRLAGSVNRGRFNREADVLARLDHPNIVGILDRGRTVAGSFFLVMPFVEGRPLDRFADECRREGPVGTRRLLETFVKLASALGEVHALGVVHRDLKPSNVLIDGRNEPHLLDFGLARLIDGTLDWRTRTITRAGEVVGSLPWTSPEQASGGSADAGAASDVYALGVCLYQSLTGCHPYDIHGSIPDLISRIRRAHPPRLGDVPGVRGDTVQRVLDRCLAKAAEERYADASALANDLCAALDGRAVPRPVSVLTRRRHAPVLWAAGAFVLALGLAIAAICWPRWSPGRQAVTVFKPLSVENGLGMTLVQIPAGTFQMGTLDKSEFRGDDERSHTVTITRPYWIATREVTAGQFAGVMQRTAPPDPTLPACGVAWADAVEFCRRLSQREGATYRLPTEAQWERACRAGHEGHWAGTGDADEMGWHAGNSGGHVHPGGLKRPNHWGLFDMHGNAAEWCEDFYNPIYPITREDPLYRDHAANHVTRGGSYVRPAVECRSAARGREARDTPGSDIGFRVVMDSPSAVPATRLPATQPID
jgi:formylglycine-generating enzyme required for sulfatase activity